MARGTPRISRVGRVPTVKHLGLGRLRPSPRAWRQACRHGGSGAASFEFTHQVADLIVACAFPSVVTASVKRARTPSGLADRELLFEHMGALAARVHDQSYATKRTCNAEKTSSDPLAFLRKDPTDNGTTH
jgi:hypothetical protein